MLTFFPLIFISCPKPTHQAKDISSPKILEWQVSSSEFVALEAPTTQVSQQGILSHWEDEEVHVIANTPCHAHSKITAEVTSFTNKELLRLESTGNSFGELSISFPIHRVKRDIHLRLSCNLDSENDWQITHRLQRNERPFPQLYSPVKWHAKKENSICFLDATQGYIELDYRRLGEIQDDEGFHIGIGEQGEWQTLMRAHIHKPLECIQLEPTETFSAPLEMRLRLRKDGIERELRRIVTPKPSIWVSAPQKLEQGKKALLQIKVDNPSAFSLIDLKIKTGKTQTSYKIPLSKQGTVTLPFQPTSGGFHQVIASFGKVTTQTAFWVEEKQAFTLSPASKLPKNEEDFHWLLLSTHKLPEYDEHATPFRATMRVHTPPFLRLGDQAKQTNLSWDESAGLTEEIELLPIGVFDETFPVPLFLSPSDDISLQVGTERLYEQSSLQNFELSISSQPYYLTTDSNFSAPLISDLLSDLLAPHHPKTDAHFIQRTALAWNSLAAPKAPWFDLILERAKENLEWLTVWQENNGWGNPEVDLLVIHALMEAQNAGLSPKTSFLFAGIDYLCSGGESPRWAHLRWKLTQSQTDLYSCEEIAEPLWNEAWKEKQISHPQTPEDWEIFLLEKIHNNESLVDLTDRIAPFYQDIPDNPWLEFAIWSWEKHRYQSYHNLRLSVSSQNETLHKGLFHTWQRKNIFARFEALPETPPISLQVDGIGSLHWGLWQFLPKQRPPQSTEDFAINRRLLQFDQQEASLSDLHLGETLFLEHEIQGKPNQKLLLSIFPPANLLIFEEAAQEAQGVIHKEIILDSVGKATLQMPVLNYLSGSFQFPASQIQKNDMIAHSGDWIIQSQ